MLTDHLFDELPNLRDRFVSPADSFFRDLDVAILDEKMRSIGASDDWRYPDEHRERIRKAFMADLPPGDVWVFAYGSLMWDPAIIVSEIRMANLVGFHRRFCLKTEMGRGTKDFPGLMAGLDDGGACAGLVMRIDAHNVEAEMERLWLREMLLHAYRPEIHEVSTSKGPINAIAFVVDHTAPNYCPDLSDSETAFMIATGVGELGSSYDYLSNLAHQFEAIGVEDPDLQRLYRDATAAKVKFYST